MTTATAEQLYAHSKECGSHEFTLHETDKARTYDCRKCQAAVAQEPAQAETPNPAKKKAA